jgi:hypothetical protein
MELAGISKAIETDIDGIIGYNLLRRSRVSIDYPKRSVTFPIWPSLGLIHGSRSSGDIGRRWSTFAATARENLLRNWQNGKLWWNDPDCLCLSGNLPANEYSFHATAIYATGGMGCPRSAAGGRPI